MRKIVFTLSLAALMPAMVMAHPGHGASNGHDWIHYLASPGHVLPVALTIGLIVLVLLRSYRKSRQHTVQKEN